MLLRMACPIHFYGWIIFHCVYIPHLLYLPICRWTFKSFLCLGSCKYCCCEHQDSCIFLNYSFLWVYVQEWDCKELYINHDPLTHPVFKSHQGVWVFWAWAALSPHLALQLSLFFTTPPCQQVGSTVCEASEPKCGSVTKSLEKCPRIWLLLCHFLYSVCYNLSLCHFFNVCTMLSGIWASQVAQLVKNLPAMQEILGWFLGREDPLEKG